MDFRYGQTVRITKIDAGDEPGWYGFLAEVVDTSVSETSTHLVGGGSQTQLRPYVDRPDSHYPYVDPRGLFFWPTQDLELVEEEENG